MDFNAETTKVLEKPSVVKPWLKLYGAELPKEKDIECSVNHYLWNCNRGHMSDIALSYYNNDITFQQLYDNVQQTAQALLASGVKEGDIVTVCSVMTPEIIYLFYAMDLIGATPNMVDPRTSSQGIKEYITEVDSKLVCTLNVAYPKIKKAVVGTNVTKVLVVSPADSLKGAVKVLYKTGNRDKNEYDANVVFWKQFFATGKNGKPALSDDNYDPNRGTLFVHTGGTSGLPKGVLLGAKAINALAVQYGINGFQRKQRFLDVMPPFIAYGFVCGVHLPLTQGATSVLIPNLDPNELGSLLLKYKPAHMAGVPLHYQTLAKDPKMQNADLSFLITSGVGGDAISTGAEKEVNDFLKAHGCKYPLAKGYGMTEVASTATTCMGNNNKLGSVGIPLCMTTVSIFEPGTDHELGFNEEGEICVSGPNLMIGYYNNPTETQNSLRLHSDGKYWMHTGDIGMMDEDGYVFLKSRIKRVIIRHDGFKVYSTSIENVVSHHPDVEKCSVVGVTDRDHVQGKLPVLFLVWKEAATKAKSSQELEKEIQQLCERELAEYALPILYKTVDALPYTGIGKIDYRQLEEEAEKMIAVL